MNSITETPFRVPSKTCSCPDPAEPADAARIARRLGARLERYPTEESLSERHRRWARGDKDCDAVLVYLHGYESDLGCEGGFGSELDAARAYLGRIAELALAGIEGGS